MDFGGLLDNFSFPDLNDPKKMGLLMAAAGLLGRSPREPGNFGTDLSRGLLGGLQGYAGAQQSLLTQKKEALQNQLLGLQTQQVQQGLDREKARAAALQGAFGPPQQSPPSFGTASPDWEPGGTMGAPSQPPQPQSPQSSIMPAQNMPGDPRAAMRNLYYRVAQDLSQKGFGDDAQKYFDMAIKLEDEYSPTPQTLMQNGQPVSALLSKQGNVRNLTGYAPPPQTETVNLGGKSQVIDKLRTPAGTSFPHTMSPDAIASNAIALQNLNIKKFEVDPFGMFGINKSPTGFGGQPANPPASGQPQASSLPNDVPPAVAANVQAMIEGRIAAPSSFALKTPYWQGMMQLANQIDPNFDATVWASRNKTRSAFAAGNEAQNVKALSTAANHLGGLAEAYDALNNNRFPVANTVINTVGNAGASQNIQANYARVAAKSEAVAHELAKVFRNSGMSQGEVANWKAQISPNAAPAQSSSTIDSALDLMEGRLQPMMDQWKSAMGNMPPPKSLTDAVAAIEALRAKRQQGKTIDFSRLPK